MLDYRDKGIIIKILEHAGRIVNKTRDTEKEQFLADEDIKDIVCFHMLQIGELAKKLSDSFIETFDAIPWNSVMAMRNRIVHGYDSLDPQIIFDTAKENIPEIIDYCSKIISEDI